MIRAFKPSISVTLTKLVRLGKDASARAVSPPQEIDLTGYLGEGGAVRTHKSIREPAGGFSISFSDRKDAASLDTVYALVQPMDMIEIRAARNAWQFAGKPLPIIMRGFVTSVRRVQSIGQDGTPQRDVVISGHDYGYFWQIHQVIFQMLYITDGPYLATFRAQAATGISAALMSVTDYMTQLVGFVNNKIEGLTAYSNHSVLGFTPKIGKVAGQVTPNMASPVFGPLWNFAESFADRPWNELFTEDTEDGALFVFREAPFKDISGKIIMPNASDPGTIAVDIAEVVALDVERTDARVTNFFYVAPGPSLIDMGGRLSVWDLIQGKPLDSENANNNPGLFGVRKMELRTALFNDDLTTLPADAPAGSEGIGAEQQTVWHLTRRDQLKLINRDNVVFEDGSVTMRGSEAIKPGRYLQLTHGDLVSEAYMVSVAHNFQPLGTWTTQVQIERGNGFIQRVKLGKSPYLAEGKRGPYSK